MKAESFNTGCHVFSGIATVGVYYRMYSCSSQFKSPWVQDILPFGHDVASLPLNTPDLPVCGFLVRRVWVADKSVNRWVWSRWDSSVGDRKTYFYSSCQAVSWEIQDPGDSRVDLMEGNSVYSCLCGGCNFYIPQGLILDEWMTD